MKTNTDFIMPLNDINFQIKANPEINRSVSESGISRLFLYTKNRLQEKRTQCCLNWLYRRYRGRDEGM